jgi:chromosomal replication initiator protein
LTTSDRDVVAALGKAIARRIGEPRYNLWFERHTKFTWENGLLIIGVPNYFLQEYLQDKFAEDVRAAACETFAGPVEARFVIDPELFRAARLAQGDELGGKGESASCAAENESGEKRESADHVAPACESAKDHSAEPEGSAPKEDARSRPRKQIDTESNGKKARPKENGLPAVPRAARPRRWRRLKDFVVGACNRVAHASAVNVIETPGEGPNPLVFHGPVGTGKTHLLEGIYGGLRQGRSQWRVCYVTSEDFTNRFVQSLRFGKLASFRKHFRECDVLLIDDLHFLARKRASHEEFLHTLDALHSEGKQVVITCDCHPRLADQYTPELLDRLLGGGIWSLAPPDRETRIALMRNKSAADGQPPFPEDVVCFVAENLRGNVRELEGAVHCIRHLARVAGRGIDLGLAREAIGDLIRHAVRVVHLADVDRAVCQVLRLDAGALQSKQRVWMVCHPRMLAMFLARKHTAATYGEIGSHFGERNHSTAVAAEKKVRQWLQDNGELCVGERPLRARDIVELVERELLR